MIAEEKISRDFYKLAILSFIILAINILIILSIVPVLESSTLPSKIVNLIVFPSNFIFEDLFGISSIKYIDKLSWILLAFYDILIAKIIFIFIEELRKSA